MPPASGEAGRTSDDNNGFDTAAALPAEGFIVESLNFTDDRADFFKLEASAGDIINAWIYIIDYDSLEPARINFNLGLFNPSRALLGWSNSTYQYDSLSELALVCGTYYIQVATVNGTGGYTMDYSAGPARIVTDGMSFNGSLTNTTYNNTNWYRVQLRGGAAADHFCATIHEGPNVNFDLYFMDLWSGYSFWYDVSWANDPDESVEAVATYTGFYYLKVYDYRGVGNYKLNITIEPASGHAGSEPAGAKAVSYNSTFSGHVDMSTEHYNWYKMGLSQGETVTASMRLDPQPSDMFALSILQPDQSTLPDWSKTNYVDGVVPTLARVISITKTAPAAGTYYIVAMAKVGLQPTVRDLSDRNAASDYILNVNFSMHMPPPTNHPPAATPPGIIVDIDENARYDLDIGKIFSDPDGDVLRYAARGASRIDLIFDADAKKVSFAPARNWYGNENITITATDPYDACATVWVNMTVRRVQLPPEIFEKAPAADALNGTNGSVLRFRIFATDPEGVPLSYRWTAGGSPLAASGNSTDWKIPSGAGTIMVNVTVSNQNMSASADWAIGCLPRQPLNVVIQSPLNRTTVKEGQKVIFYAMLSGVPDSELANMDFSWYLGDRLLHDGADFCSTSLPAGTDVIEVRVQNRSEPAQSGRAGVVVFVEKKPAGPDKLAIMTGAAVVSAAAVVVGAAVFVLARNRKGREKTDVEEGDKDRDSPARIKKNKARDGRRRRRRHARKENR
jgi:hypothetical protein